jgi:hypothetical protein
MSQLAHRIYIGTMASIVVLTFMVLLLKGIPYYSTSIEERFYHPDHALFKPSGVFGHGLGIVGTLLILIGVFGYQAKKRFRWLNTRFGRLKYWLEFHIFLCSLPTAPLATRQTAFAGSTFNLEQHAKTKFPLDGAHAASPCFDCHLKNVGEVQNPLRR